MKMGEAHLEVTIFDGDTIFYKEPVCLLLLLLLILLYLKVSGSFQVFTPEGRIFSLTRFYFLSEYCFHLCKTSFCFQTLVHVHVHLYMYVARVSTYMYM